MKVYRALISLIILSLSWSIIVTAQEAEMPPVPRIDEGGYDIVNILLVGVANENLNRAGLADSIILVSVNRDVKRVSVLSLPRDLWVSIEGHGMDKLNTAHFYGETDPDTSGVTLLKGAIRDNLGIDIDYYARIDFNDLKQIIDTLGGLTITVDCALQDWKIIDPEGDKNDEDNWELFTLWGGVHVLDGETALWYARSRRTSSDLDRSRRQQDILRALWRTFQRRGFLNDLSTLYDQFVAMVDTDLTPDILMSFAPLALTIDTGDVDYFHMRVHQEIENAFSEGTGKAIFEINHEAMTTLLQNFILPPSLNQRGITHPTVAIVNSSGMEAWGYVAAHRLELEGFKTVIVEEPATYREWNHIVDYTGDDKGNPIGTLQKVLRVTEEGIEQQPDPNRIYDYKVFIGGNYGQLMCNRSIVPPKPLDENGNPIETASDGA